MTCDSVEFCGLVVGILSVKPIPLRQHFVSRHVGVHVREMGLERQPTDQQTPMSVGRWRQCVLFIAIVGGGLQRVPLSKYTVNCCICGQPVGVTSLWYFERSLAIIHFTIRVSVLNFLAAECENHQ